MRSPDNIWDSGASSSRSLLVMPSCSHRSTWSRASQFPSVPSFISIISSPRYPSATCTTRVRAFTICVPDLVFARSYRVKGAEILLLRYQVAVLQR